PRAPSSRRTAARFTHHPTVSTATKDPSVCIPEPNVKSHGTKIALLIVGGIDNTKTDPATIHTAFSRLNDVLSVKPATSTSNAPTSDRYPAPKRPTKNRQPNSAPAGIAANAFGSVAKMSPGPDVTSSPSANTAGMIASPQRSAEPVSPATVHSAGRASDSFASTYEP